jgi:two-component system phosphate regulon response regulator PhoB|tara:strand:+ start:773 stop:1465 length:693 start_codon:yes stop_codon:yes gene_type:complete
LNSKILVVEDEVSIAELIKLHLNRNNFECLLVHDGDDVLPTIESYIPDLIILDWMIPNISGLEVLKRIKMKSEYIELPILMLTAKNAEQDKILGFENGVDDYLAKPFIPSELIARVKAILKRTQQKDKRSDLIIFEDISINKSQRKVFRNNRKLNLGPTEFNILLFFIQNKKKVFSRDFILNRIWPHDVNIDLRTVDVHIRRLRKELNANGEQDFIRTVRSAGYSIDNEN